MASLLVKKLTKLQDNVENIRNICILAHVDHGKTSLADSLVATNGVISSRLAGKLRYMDSRKDEQERGITMKSSAISLFYLEEGAEYLVNLMDSPGHVDFSSEVSTAVRLCDGAVLLVDVVEGVQPQTKVVLRQAWDEGIKPVLVLNKIDRLVVETGLDPLAAYHHMAVVLEQVNALVGEMFTQEVAVREEKVRRGREEKVQVEFGVNDVYDWSSGLEEADDSKLYFSPENENVVFCSAIDGWAFSLQTFARIFSKKLGFSEKVLQKTLWGDFFINMKAKKIYSGAAAQHKKPLFVSLVLENIWSIYDCVLITKDKVKLERIVSSLGLTVPPRDLRSPDPRTQLSAVFSAWLPLAAAVLRVVVHSLPSPAALTAERAENLICSRTREFSSLPAETRELREHFTACLAGGPIIVFVSKMFPVPRAELPGNRARPLTLEELEGRKEAARAGYQERMEGQGAVELTAEQMEGMALRNSGEGGQGPEEGEVAFIAFARVYSGVLQEGDEVLVLGPKYDPAATAPGLQGGGGELPGGRHVARVRLGALYLLLGRDLEPVTRVPAGNVVGIGGLSSAVLKSATLSSSPWCPPFVPLVQSSVPILRVALEPARSSDLARLQAGLHLLNQADAHVEVSVSEAGEMVLATAGEVHLQRCLADLALEYAKCEVTVSEPIVPFRETIVRPPDMDMVNEAIEKGDNKEGSGMVTIETPNKQCRLVVKAVSLPGELARLLEEEQALLRGLDRQGVELPTAARERLAVLREKLGSLLGQVEELRGREEQLWSFGPKRCGPNILLNCTEDWSSSSTAWGGQERREGQGDVRQELESSLLQGFQLASLAGPLCEEQMMGVAFLLLEWTVEEQGEEGWGPLSGQIVSAMKEGCRRAFSLRPQRLMTAMYSCQIQVKAEALGKMYNVLARRRGKVVQEEMVEGSSTFTVTAHIPVVESMDFGGELRKQTSGLAMPQLVFSHWEVLEVDPLWEPTTEEELLHFGEKADSENPARKYVNAVRKRKGLRIDEKIVEFAEKQRTIGKNK